MNISDTWANWASVVSAILTLFSIGVVMYQLRKYNNHSKKWEEVQLYTELLKHYIGLGITPAINKFLKTDLLFLNSVANVRNGTINRDTIDSELLQNNPEYKNELWCIFDKLTLFVLFIKSFEVEIKKYATIFAYDIYSLDKRIHDAIPYLKTLPIEEDKNGKYLYRFDNLLPHYSDLVKFMNEYRNEYLDSVGIQKGKSK
jgi:hypothetical protein